ncbi:TPA: pilus assembly protein N-terminal domain-containing protein [Aeromonas dhakensis]|nr:pilus assembly protein N-terminal domain-containing protein [Aeromonas dhakensis]
MKKTLIAATLLGFLISFTVAAGSYYPGDTKVINLDEKPVAVVVGSAQVADYQVIDGGVILIAKGIGRTTFKVVGENNKIIYSEGVRVADETLDEVSKLAKSIDPFSNIVAKKTAANGWYISGTTSNEDKKEQICNAVQGYFGESTIASESYDLNQYNAEAKRFRNGSIKTVCAVKALNNKSKLINISVKLVEVSSGKREALGINWFDSRVGDGGIFVLGEGVNPIKGLITALVEDSSSQVIAEPNLTLLSGERASFKSGGEISVVTKDDDGDATVTFREYGTMLNIGAEVVDDYQIRVALNTGNSSLDPANTYIAGDGSRAPALRTQNMSTVVNVPNGETFAIGGMTSTSLTTKDTGVPFLSSIPYLSALFTTTQDETEKKELIVLVTVRKAFTENVPSMKVTPASKYFERLLSVRTEYKAHEIVFAPYVQ